MYWRLIHRYQTRYDIMNTSITLRLLSEDDRVATPTGERVESPEHVGVSTVG